MITFHHTNSSLLLGRTDHFSLLKLCLLLSCCLLLGSCRPSPAPLLELELDSRRWASLPAHQADLSGTVQLNGQSSLSNGWAEPIYGPESQLSWPLKIDQEGRFLFELIYEFLLPGQERSYGYEDIGFAATVHPAVVQIQIGNQQLDFRARPFAGRLIAKHESHLQQAGYERSWGKTQRAIRLAAGTYQVQLSAPDLDRPGLAIKGLRLQVVPD